MRSARAATSLISSARLRSTPNGWNPSYGDAATRRGSGGSSRSNGPGTGSPNPRAIRAHARRASIPVTFCSKITGRSASSTRSVLVTWTPANRARSRPISGSLGRNAESSSEHPSARGATSSAHSPPGPQASTSIRSPRRTAWNVAGPSGVRVARTISSFAIRIVGSPPPCHIGATERTRSRDRSSTIARRVGASTLTSPRERPQALPRLLERLELLAEREPDEVGTELRLGEEGRARDHRHADVGREEVRALRRVRLEPRLGQDLHQQFPPLEVLEGAGLVVTLAQAERHGP